MHKDKVMTLTKLDIPSTDDYVCLGHFDRAHIITFSDPQAPAVGQICSFYDFNDPTLLLGYETKDPEGLQQNYLIHTEYEYGIETNDFCFRFVMTISLNKQYSEPLSAYLVRFVERLVEGKKFNVGFHWMFYYPVARGDVILILDCSDFVTATKALYEFVFQNADVLYSYTIPMIKSSWLNSTEHSSDESKECSMQLRATVKDYQRFYQFVRGINVPCRQKGFPKFFASFGTDDVQVDFGRFSEKKLYKYLKAITESGNQDKYRGTVFSSEIAIPRLLTGRKRRK